MRLLLPHHPIEPLSPADIARFTSYVTILGQDDCWPWKSCVTNGHYGHFRIGRRVYKAHRIALAIAVGPPASDGLIALHSCDNPPCCNPAHLRWGSYKQNAIDRSNAGRANRPTGANHHFVRRPDLVPRGEKCGGAKLTDAQVLKIRRSPGTLKEVAAEFGVSFSLISLIRRRKIWTHI